MESPILGIGSRIKHAEFGMGVIIQVKTESYVVTFLESGSKEILKSYKNFELIHAEEPREDLVSLEEMENRLIKIFQRYADIQETVPMADKWRGGKLIFQAADPNKSGKEILIDTFFHKIVMTRDRLRVLEQRINSSNLTEDEKIDLQQYITRIYGSLTSFNVLFKDKKHFFVGTATAD